MRLLAVGGMGEVYVAIDEVLEREVAVKILGERSAEDTEVRRRFTREALAAARLSGERNIVTIYDVGEHDGQPFIVMAYMSGGSLDRRLRHSSPSVAQSLAWLEHAAVALDAAHRHGIVHRDVKPGNLLLDAADVVHVGDFGIARATGLDSLTSPGTILGSAGYLSPEQAAGVSASTASDRYSLGVVAFELLTGRRPFADATPTAEAFAHMQAAVPRVRDANPELPGALDEVFGHALAKDPHDRPASCKELVEELRAAFWNDESATVAGPVSRAAPTAVTAGRPRRAAPLVATSVWLVLGLAGAGAGVAVWRLAAGNGTPHPSPRAPAQVESQTRTVTKTVAAAASPAPARTSAVDARTPSQLNDAGYALLVRGDASGALPLLERAVAGLQGSGSLAEAYASYNLAWARFELGRCTGVLELLARSEAVQGHRKEIDHLRKRAEKSCRAGEQHGNSD